MASAFARTLPSSLSSRTLFVKCSPAPTNFTERRAVLKALATAGTDSGIEVFKKLEDSSSFIAVTADPERAKTLVSDSPYKRILHVQDSATAATFSTAAWGAAYRSTITDPVNVQSLEEWGGQSKVVGNTIERGDLGLQSKIFTIHVFPGNAAYNHKRAIGTNPLHGPWPGNDGYGTYISSALRKSLPSGYMSTGLRDWETGRQLSEERAGFENEGAESLLGQARRRAFFLKERRRKSETEVPDVMRSLATVAESGSDSGFQPAVRELTRAQRFAAEVGVSVTEEVSETGSEESPASLPTVNKMPEESLNETSKVDPDIEPMWSTLSRGSGSHGRGPRATPSRIQPRSRQSARQKSPTTVGAGSSQNTAASQDFTWDDSKVKKKGETGKSVGDGRVSPAQFSALFNTPATRISSTSTGAGPLKKKGTPTDFAWDAETGTKKSQPSKKSAKGSRNGKPSKSKPSRTSDARLSTDKFYQLFKGS